MSHEQKISRWILIASVIALALIMVGIGWQRASASPIPENQPSAQVVEAEVPTNPVLQTDDQDDDEDKFDDEGFEDEFDETAASLIGIPVEELYSELDSGKSIADVARVNGVDPQVIIDALVAEELGLIDELIASGEISAEEAAEWRAETAAYIAFEVNTVDPYVEAAALIGIDVDTLWTEVDRGKSLAEIAEANGVDPQILIDAAIAYENQMIDEMAAAGLITEEEAAEWRSETPAFAAELVNETFEAFDEEIYEEHEGCDFDEDEDFYPEESAAAIIGISVDELYEQLDGGQSMADVARANGVDPQIIIDALIAEEVAWIDELAAAGELSDQEAEAWREEAAQYITFEVNTVFVDPFVEAAALIGIDIDVLWAEVDSGKSLAEIAQANGVDPQTLIDAGIAAENQLIDAEVAAGLLTAEEAAEWRAEVPVYVSDMVNEPWGLMEFEEEWFEEEDSLDESDE